MTKDRIVNADGLTEEEFLASYKVGNYERPSNTVDMLLFTIANKNANDVRKDVEKELKVLLIKRKNHPYIHKWALPGGFVNIDEDIDTAANRELSEETSVENVYMEQLYTYGDVDRDKRTRVISIAHLALVPYENIKPIAGDDAEAVAWFSLEKVTKGFKTQILLKNQELGLEFVYDVETSYTKNGVISIPRDHIIPVSDGIAFDHIYMINQAIDRIRNKIEYIPLAFNLVPEKFTLNEIQQVYEVLLGKKLIKQNFRKWVERFVEELDEKQTDVGHRPAALYRYVEKHIGAFDKIAKQEE